MSAYQRDNANIKRNSYLFCCATRHISAVPHANKSARRIENCRHEMQLVILRSKSLIKRDFAKNYRNLFFFWLSHAYTVQYGSHEYIFVRVNSRYGTEYSRYTTEEKPYLPRYSAKKSRISFFFSVLVRVPYEYCSDATCVTTCCQQTALPGGWPCRAVSWTPCLGLPAGAAVISGGPAG